MVFRRRQVKTLLECEEPIVGVRKLSSDRPWKGPQGVKLETITNEKKYLSYFSVSSDYKTDRDIISVRISYQCRQASNHICSNRYYKAHKTHG